MGKEKMNWVNRLKKNKTSAVPTAEQRTKEAVINEYNQAAIGLVQRMQLVSKMNQEIQGISDRLNQLEAELKVVNENEQNNNKTAAANESAATK